MGELSSHILGGMAALTSAFCWALSAILFRQVGESLAATAMNWWKGVIALGLLSIVLIPELPGFELSESYIRLAASGLLGIFIGDTLYFMALTRLGPRVTLLVGTLIPVVTAILAVVIFGDHLSLLGWFGLFLTLWGVGWVLWTGAHGEDPGKDWRSGLLYGLGFVLANAVAIILTKQGVAELSAEEATWIRTLWAVMALGAYAAIGARFSGWIIPLRSAQLRYRLVAAAVIGALIGTWLSILALKYTFASVAAALNSTSPIFIIPLMLLFYKETPHYQSVVGAVVAVAGVALYFVSVSS